MRRCAAGVKLHADGLSNAEADSSHRRGQRVLLEPVTWVFLSNRAVGRLADTQFLTVRHFQCESMHNSVEKAHREIG